MRACADVPHADAVRHAAVAALLLVTALVYAPSLNHPFQYDDGHTLAANAALRQPGAWRAAFMGTSLSSAEKQRRLRPVPKLDQNVRTGPAIGARIPVFAAVDQNGRRQTFETLRGPKGLVLLFVRSADW